MPASETTEAAGKVTVPHLDYFTKIVHHEAYASISPLKPELSARGKNIVVTGGGTGIGKQIALEFGRAGARSVSILGRREDRLKNAVEEIIAAATDKTTISTYEMADLMKREEVDDAMRSIAAKVGKLDILVSNAGVLPNLGPIVGYDSDELMRGFNVNVLSAFNAVQAFLNSATPSPMIINISTCITHMAPMPGVSGYATSKAANLKMMDYFAAENPHLHIVNVQPGTVTTEMSEKAQVEGKDAGKSSSSCSTKKSADRP